MLRTIDPDLAGYIIEFKAEMEQRGALPTWAPMPMAITYGRTPPEAVGICYIPANVIIIESWLRDTPEECERKTTIYHELTHCMGMISKHSSDPRHIMYYKQMPCSMDNWNWQMDELAKFIKKYSPIYDLKHKLETPVDVSNDF